LRRFGAQSNEKLIPAPIAPGNEAGCQDRAETENGAVTSAVLVHLRVEPAHFDWRWRERPALALLAWEA
jgi:hypothetical protein